MSGGTVLVGRTAECARLDALLDGARAGRSGVLVVRGEAGVGKTAVLDYAARQATDMRVLRARGVEAESELAFASLDELLRPLLGHLDALPEPQAVALRGALALAPGAAGDRFAVYAATLGLLGEAAERGPLLVLVDDAHWLDRASAEALLFAARRLEVEGIALVFAAREGDPDRFDAPGFDELRLQGLDREAAGRLLEAHVALPLAAEVAERLVGETRGNPLALIELAQLLSPAELAGEQPLGEPLVAGDAARRAFVRRAAALAESARAALLVAAAAGDGDVAPVVAALEVLGIGAEALGAAEAAGLIVVADGRLSFAHPLVRSAIYGAAPPAARRAAHRALADAMGQQRPDRRAWHLAAATVGPDEQVAAALERAAETARRRSGYAAAARALERAARLTPDGGPLVERLVAGGDAARWAGATGQALALFAEASEQTADPATRARIEFQQARIEVALGRPRRGEQLFMHAARLVEHHNPEWAGLLLVEASLVAGYAGGDHAAALTTARRAHGAMRGRGDVAELASDAILAVALYWSGDALEAHRLLTSALATTEERHETQLDTESALFVAEMRLWAGVQVERARSLVTRVTEDTRRTGALGFLPFALYVSCYLNLRDGNWAQAYADAAEGALVAVAADNIWRRCQLLGCLALIEAARGAESDCRAHADEALALVQRTELARPPEIDEALGLLELGLGQPREAIWHLDRATRTPTGARNDRLARPSLADLVEAHVRDPGESVDELMSAVRAAGEGDFDGSAATTERCKALVAGDDRFDAHFKRALELHGTAWPFARARTELCYGERLRRAGRRVGARAQLRAALETFERLGARPWAERAGGELRATGERIARRDPTAAEQLTPQELQIALTVARGATNREAGAALFLSPKTIDFHLGRVYRKLGIRSRVELAHALHAAPEPADKA